MTLPTAAPKPTPRSEADKRASRIAAVQKLERSRRKPIAKSARPHSVNPPRKPVKRRNAKRRASEFARCFHSRARVRFVKSMGCLVCESIAPIFGQLSVGKCDNAHTVKEGMGRRGHYSTIVPLCRTHHRWYDERVKFLAEPNVRAFIASFAASVEAAWQRWAALHGIDP